ncbi:hypothetical protein N7452_005089 [Penicillium brevicompactum]|uniref:Uncharacterized protein n=1 Tax=Penicillium brevicompactum TaxID=5074 RepID=A0A9W9UH33_PENBR|nr:hypothetical protein N7452_005089 [Penicillium brevicompactum]
MSQHEALEAPDGSALTWIFDHCLRYADSYEISLRAAYELNCNPTKNLAAMGSSAFARSRSPSLFSRNSSFSKNTKSTRSSGSSYDAGYDTNAEFRACLTRTVSELPSQPCSLPPSFIISFVRRCFCLELHNVDFAQALTSLDYLKDLQGRWKKEIDSAFRRLNVTAQDARDPQHSEVARKYPGVMEWYAEISQKARMIDFMYTQIYVGMRRWILVNEMMLEPFNKANCLALLNTLLPPQLAPKILENHRDAFFKFITTYEANPGILEPVMIQGARPGEENGWPALYDTFDRYLNAVLEMIDECALINEPAQVDKSGHSRRTDSGISFGPRPPSRPTTSHSSDTEKPLPEFPAPSDGASKHGSVLERFAYSISSWGKNGKKARNLRKMQSCKELKPEKAKVVTDFSKMSFDLTEQKRRRLIDEAIARKAVEEAEADAKTIGQAI